MEEMLTIPPGFRFWPSEEELIKAFLWAKIMGQPTPSPLVQEVSLYAGDPWHVLKADDHANKYWIPTEKDERGNVIKKTIYVFTKLTKKADVSNKNKKKKNKKNVVVHGGGGGKEQFVRTAGCGTWHAQTGTKEVKDRCSGQILGFKRTVNFEVRELNPSSLSHQMGHYIMNEFFIDNEGEHVVCEIVLDLLKECKRSNKGCLKMKRQLVTDDDNLILTQADDDGDGENISNPKKKKNKKSLPRRQQKDDGMMMMMVDQYNSDSTCCCSTSTSGSTNASTNANVVVDDHVNLPLIMGGPQQQQVLLELEEPDYLNDDLIDLSDDLIQFADGLIDELENL